MTDINEEIRIAQKIISKNEYNNKSNFHRNSFIYKFTNENVNIFYNYINNKEKVLEVISSGDQILNSILGNTYNIDAFDISIFPKHLLFLLTSDLAISFSEVVSKYFTIIVILISNFEIA